MLRIDKDACTVTTDDTQAELALLADGFETVAEIEPEGGSLALKWESTKLDPTTGLATMHFEVDEYDALEMAIEEADIYIEPSESDTDEAPGGGDGITRRRKP